MSVRALIVGLIGAFCIAGGGYINDHVFGFESFTSGHLLPTIVIGLLFFSVIVINPLLARLGHIRIFTPAEMTLVTVLMITACSIPAGGLMSTFTQVLVMPHHWNQVNPGWRENHLLDYAPKQALVDASDHDRVVTGFITGAREVAVKPTLARHIREAVQRVPWESWLPPLRTWLPMVFLTALASASLALMVHRQWSRHECLSYPIADFAGALLQREPGRILPDILGNRVFWTGFGIIFLIRLNNAVYQWYPEYFVPIKFVFNFRPIGVIWPAIYKAPFGSSLLVVHLYPLAIAFAFFLSSEIALTLGLTQFLWVLFSIPLVTMGVALGTQYGKGGWAGWQRAGSYTAMTFMLFYTGRRYYGEILLRALFLRRSSEPAEGAVWACRFFLLSVALLVGLVMGLGLELPFALGTVVLMLMSFLVVSRLSAETGLFWIHPRWQPYGALLGLFGCYAMKPEAIVISALVCLVLCINQGEVLMPYLCNGLKLCEKAKLNLPRVTGVTLGMYVAGVFLAVIVVLSACYDVGTPINFNWSYQRIPTMPFRNVEPEVQRLKATGMLASAETLPWYSRMQRIQPRKNFLWAAGFGFVAILAFSILRLRFPRWPLHPALFLLWASWPMVVLSHSFFIGWLIKKAALHFGGSPVIKKMKPLMVGVIAGEIAGAFCCMLAGIIWYLVTGEKRATYRFIP